MRWAQRWDARSVAATHTWPWVQVQLQFLKSERSFARDSRGEGNDAPRVPTTQLPAKRTTSVARQLPPRLRLPGRAVPTAVRGAGPAHSIPRSRRSFGSFENLQQQGSSKQVSVRGGGGLRAGRKSWVLGAPRAVNLIDLHCDVVLLVLRLRQSNDTRG